MNLVWKEGQAVPHILRLAIFVFLSLCVHLLILQFSISRQAEFQRSQEHGVGYVSRSVKEFVIRSERPKQIAAARVPTVGAVQQVPLQSQIRVPKKQTIDKAATLKKVIPPKPAEVQSIPKPVVPETTEIKAAAPQTPTLVPENQQISETVTEPVAAPVLSSQVKNVSAVGTTSDLAEMSRTPPQVEESGADSYQEALPRYDINPLPKYPEVARRRGLEGTVTLEVLVLADGRVGEMDLVGSSGFNILDKAALKAVRHWQFKPAISLSAPVESRVLVPVDFVLNDN